MCTETATGCMQKAVEQLLTQLAIPKLQVLVDALSCAEAFLVARRVGAALGIAIMWLEVLEPVMRQGTPPAASASPHTVQLQAGPQKPFCTVDWQPDAHASPALTCSLVALVSRRLVHPSPLPAAARSAGSSACLPHRWPAHHIMCHWEVQSCHCRLMIVEDYSDALCRSSRPPSPCTLC